MPENRKSKPGLKNYKCVSTARCAAEHCRLSIIFFLLYVCLDRKYFSMKAWALKNSNRHSSTTQVAKNKQGPKPFSESFDIKISTLAGSLP